MGLDITAYSHVIPVSDEIRQRCELAYEEGEDLPEEVFHLFDNRAFEGRVGSLQGGFYTLTEDSHKFGFRAGSYSGYGEWRDALARYALGISAPEVWRTVGMVTQPFGALIYFSDCEGTLGPEICARLYQDFVEQEARVTDAAERELEGDHAWFMARYKDWAKAFALGKEQGCVCFH